MKILLYPFAIIFHIITTVRMWCYDLGILKSTRVKPLVISVGNLTVGGTGKTPHVEYLVRLLHDRFRIALLSRGYGRKTKGFIMANNATGANIIGDEPRQYYEKFHSIAKICVGEDRVEAVDKLLKLSPESRLVILDDAYQHRAIERNVNILVCDYNRPFYNDHLMPVGRLREARHGAERADIVIVSKCPSDLSSQKKMEIQKKIRRYIDISAAVFFSEIKYSTPVSFGKESVLGTNVVLLTGIARAALLANKVSDDYQMLKWMEYPDHHFYTEKDIDKIIREFSEIPGVEKALVTTEKDMVRLKSSPGFAKLKELPLFYIPIEVSFGEEARSFEVKTLEKLFAH